MFTSILFSFFFVNVIVCDNVTNSDFIGWHQKFGIKEAERIKKTEDEIRIVGGYVAPVHAHPYLAGLVIDVIGLNHPSACGGSLISSTRVLTAAHCWNDGRFQAWRFTVVLGSAFLYHGGIRMFANAIAPHPHYDARTLANDIALLYLPSAVPFSDAVRPIALPSGSLLNMDFTGTWMQASGYGKYSDLTNPTINTMIRNIFLQVIPLRDCMAVYSSNFVRDSNVCTNGNGGVGICQGDSGGPLALKIQGYDILIGVSSFVAQDGCELGFPSAFARVASYITWIKMQL